MQMQLHALKGLPETIAALKTEAAKYRAQAMKIAGELPKKRDLVKLLEYQIKTGNTDDPGTARRWADKTIIQINTDQAQAILLENKASVIEGSIISLKLQAQQQDQAAARIVAQAKAAELAAQQAKTVPVPVQVAAPIPEPKQVRVTAPITPRAGPGYAVQAPGPVAVTRYVNESPQIPEAPLPVQLPPISTMQPASVAPVVPITPEVTPASDMKKLLPWALAAVAAFMF